MGYYTYCRKCHEGLNRPDIQELKQGYIECWNCGEYWDDINQIEFLFGLVEGLQEQIKEIKNGRIKF